MLSSHDANGSIPMDMCVVDLDLSISPDSFGLRAFDHQKPLTRMLPGSNSCELRLMLPDGFHDVLIDRLVASPTWRSGHVSPADVTALHRRWLKAVFRTMSRHGQDMERLCRGARHRPDRAFRYNAPGFCPVCEVWIESALDVHMLNFHLELARLWRCPVEWCAVWKGSVRACLEHLSEKHGGSSFFALKNVAKFFPPWTVSRSVWQTALRPDVLGMFRVHRYRVYKDPFPHPALRGGVLPRLLSCVSRAMAWLTHLRISIPASGEPSGRVPVDCYPGGAPQKNWPSPCRVSFAEDVTVLGDVSPLVCSPKHGTPTQLVSAVADDDVIVPVGETNGSSDTAPDIIPPPLGFSPFSWPVDDGNMDIEQSCFPLNVDCSPDVLTGRPDVEPSLSPITPVCADDSESVGSPEVGLLVSPLVDVRSDVAADVSRPVSPLPSVESLLLQDMLWAPVAPQSPDVDDCRATPVPRWRLAREGPFLAERSPESIRSLGAGCAFRNMIYRLRSATRGVRTSHASPAVPQVDWGSPFGQSSRDGSRTVGGQSFAGSGNSSRRSLAAGRWSDADEFRCFGPVYALAAGDSIEVDRVCLGARDFPAEEVAAGALGPRVRRASVQMEAVAALIGSVTASLVSRTHLGLELCIYVFGFSSC